jgi:hypothetical protein
MNPMTNMAHGASHSSVGQRALASNRSQAINNLGILVLFVAFLAGKFSLTRISYDYESLGGIVTDVAYWFVLPLLVLAAISINRSKFQATPAPRSFGAFALCACLLNVYMALSSTWSPYPTTDIAGQLLLVVFLIAVAYVFLRWGTEKQLSLILTITFWAGLVYAVGGLATGLNSQGRLAALGVGRTFMCALLGAGLLQAPISFLHNESDLSSWPFRYCLSLPWVQARAVELLHWQSVGCLWRCLFCRVIFGGARYSGSELHWE